MPYSEHNGSSFYFVEKGSGVPFIFQHGLGGSVDQIIKIYSPPPGVRLITFDFRGHGNTSPAAKDQYNFKTSADDISALMDHLQIDKAIVGGISMGAGVALNFALRYPSKIIALFLSRPAWLDAPMEPQIREIYGTIATMLRKHGRVKGRQFFIVSDQYKKISEESLSTALSFAGQFNYGKAAETADKFECFPADAPANDRSEWEKISVPTLVLANKSDPVHPFKYGLEYAKNIPDAVFKQITPKSINEEEHNSNVQTYTDGFIKDVLEKNQNKV